MATKATPSSTIIITGANGSLGSTIVRTLTERFPDKFNLILACRALGLGTTLTTNHLRCEDEVRALLGIPPDIYTFAMMPIGWPEEPFGPVSRKPLAEVVHADRWAASWPA